MVTIELPRSLLREDDVCSVRLDGKIQTVGDALRALERHSPFAHDKILDESGAVRQHVNIFLNAENTRFLDGLDTPVGAGSSIQVVGAISGG